MSAVYLVAQVAGERLAFAASQVDQVIEMDRLVPVPRAPDFVAGITTLRSKMLTVIDVARAVGASDQASSSRLAITAERGGCGYAFLVDGVEAVVEPEGDIEPVQVRLRVGWERYAIGTIDTPIGRALVSDVDLLIQGPREDAVEPKKKVASR